MPITPRRPPELRGRVFRGSDAVARGLLTPRQLQSSCWRRLRQDVYADASMPLTHLLQLTAVGLTGPAGSVFAGRSALVLWGAMDVASASDPVDVLLPRRVRWHAGGAVRTRWLPDGVRTFTRGAWACTSPEDAAVDVVRWCPEDDGVVLLDQLAHSGIVVLSAVRAIAAALPRCAGSARARRVAERADGLAESPRETLLRLLLIDGGLPAPTAQYVVRDGEGFIARLDFAYPELRLAIEYDGLWHAQDAAFIADRRRLNRLAAAGWTVLHVTTADLDHPSALVARVQAARARRRAELAAR